MEQLDFCSINPQMIWAKDSTNSCNLRIDLSHISFLLTATLLENSNSNRTVERGSHLRKEAEKEKSVEEAENGGKEEKWNRRKRLRCRLC